MSENSSVELMFIHKASSILLYLDSNVDRVSVDSIRVSDQV